MNQAEREQQMRTQKSHKTTVLFLYLFVCYLAVELRDPTICFGTVTHIMSAPEHQPQETVFLLEEEIFLSDAETSLPEASLYQPLYIQNALIVIDAFLLYSTLNGLDVYAHGLRP